MTRYALKFLCLIFAASRPLGGWHATAEEKQSWRRVLQGDDAKQAAKLQEQIDAAEQANDYREAIRLHEKLLALRTSVQGPDHWETVQEKWDLDVDRRLGALPANDLAGWRKSRRGALEAYTLEDQGHYAEAEPFLREYRAWCEKVFDERHLSTGASYNRLALNLNIQGKYDEAESLYRKALDITRELLGEAHPFTATGLNNLAMNLKAQARYADAQPLLLEALKLRRESLGEKHPDTITSYNNVAFNLNAQGKHGEAQILYQKVLALGLEVAGEKHPDTARCYNNLAYTLYTQGKYADAQQLYQKAVALRRDLLGEDHPDTATTYSNLALNLTAQRRYEEAQPLLETALNIRRKRLGDKHPDTANSYNSLAGNLSAQGKVSEAQPLYQKALDLRLGLLGGKHPETANCYNNLAACLIAQGQLSKGQELCQEALTLRRKTLGESHPETAQSLGNLAIALLAQRKYDEAATVLADARTSYELARLGVAGRGLDRAIFGAKQSPYDLLAATNARLASPVAAWVAAETDLARGANDETAVRRGISFTRDEQARRIALGMRLNQIQDQVFPLVLKAEPTKAENDDLLNLQNERRTLESEMAQLAAALSQRELATLSDVQAALPDDSALLLWVDATDTFDRLNEHWGCVVRHAGDPIWAPLTGSGPGGTWTRDDSDLPRKLIAAVAGSVTVAEIAELVDKLYVQRIAPLGKRLEGVDRLLIVPVNAMAGVPLDVLTDKYTISYVPSGTFLARLKDRGHADGATLLAAGDAVFPPPQTTGELPLPPGGLLIKQVLPGSNAAQGRLQPGDVLLRYAGAELSLVEQLGKLIEMHAAEKTIAVVVWRDGQRADREVAPGKLGAVIDRQPAPQAIAARREAEQMLAALARGGEWQELPGSAVEVNRLATLAGNERTVVLTRSAASEQELERLRASGELAKFRYLHFATHGEPNNARAFESALVLSQDQLPHDIPVGGGKYYDGRLTANEVIEDWQLDADLVTLSACESALGRPGGGDGLLGFAQAFLLAGARSVCLSLWKVDDTATALLMDRFYQNLLGKREGLLQPMPKAEALAEAKRWLRNLTTDEATKLAADMTGSVARGKGDAALKLVVPANESSAPKPDDHPFAHPRYWAAFILIGDPN